ncbi:MULTISPECIES: DUF3090 domain-containing protein [Brevibacterium]|jgi:uncharacterized repeat protein (TIGR03847 family)|uniref:DUF3090 domain-containing protein n=1 Tax=Brevibacterium salitolerans TaxID=1403566 RepID=A0ABN2WI82_9MICO|nr:DUF3090 domain-containing protein [Brevibacterium sp.]
MPAHVYDHQSPERFVVGTVGLPGERTFFLQATSAGRVDSFVLEKEQVEVLAERIDELLDLVRARSTGEHGVPPQPLPELEDNGGLVTPVDPEFRIGTMSMGWDTENHRLLLECFELTRADAESGSSSEPGDDGQERSVLRAMLPGPQAREFARRALQVVSAGRGECPLCHQPLDAAGHVCPRLNGVPR